MSKAGVGRLWCFGAVVAALAAACACLVAGGAFAGGPAGARALNTALQVAVTVTKIAQHVALALAFGHAMTATLLHPGPGRHRGHGSPALSPSQLSLHRSGLAWTGAFVALLALSTYLTYAHASGSLGTGMLGYFVTGTEIGRITIVAGVFALASLAIGVLARHLRGAGWSAVLLALTVVSLGFLGHAGSSVDHGNAVNAMIVHLLGMVTWLGPLLVFSIHARDFGPEVHATWLRRYSPWALFALVSLAFSGLVNALIRFSSPLELVTTGYGWIVLVKVALTLAVATAGAMQRARVVRRLGEAPADASSAPTAPWTRHFTALVRIEWLLAALLLAASSALSRSQPPVPQYVDPEDYRVLSLVGYAPPMREFTLASLVTEWHVDWMIAGLSVTFAWLYLTGVARLRKRGDSWPLRRILFWLAGCAALIFVSSAGPAAFGRIRFDAHMTQHMALMVVVPPLFVLGAPVTLLSRAVTPRNDGSRGMREWMLAILHSGYGRFVSSPPVAGFLFAGSLVVFYFSPLFTWAMFDHAGHLVMTIHFLLAGYLFAWVVMGIDPAQKPISPPLKLVTLFGTLAFHAFFGVAVVSSTFIIGEEWYNALALWSPEQLAQWQRAGGSIMWGVSEIPTAFYSIIAAVQWRMSDERSARHYDRKAAKDGDAELEAYNAYLRSMRETEPGA